MTAAVMYRELGMPFWLEWAEAKASLAVPTAPPLKRRR